MAVTATYALTCEVVETPDLALDLVATNPSFTHKLATLIEGTLNAGSTVPATKVFSDSGTLSAGAATIDLTSLTGPLATSVDFTGLKVQLLLIQNPSTNSAVLTVADGASNGYNIFGDASGQVSIPVGGGILWFGNDALDDVAVADAEIDLSSSDTDAAYNVIIVAG